MNCPACGHYMNLQEDDTIFWCRKCGGTFAVERFAEPNGIAQHQHTGWGPRG